MYKRKLARFVKIVNHEKSKYLDILKSEIPGKQEKSETKQQHTGAV